MGGALAAFLDHEDKGSCLTAVGIGELEAVLVSDDFIKAVRLPV